MREQSIKRSIRWAAVAAVAVFAAAAVLPGPRALAQFNVSNYTEQGGSRTVIGGSLDVVSGGDLDIESGGSFKLAGTAVTSTAAELNILDTVTATAAELNTLAGATFSAGTLNTGFIPLDITVLREIATNDIINTAGDAGMLSSDTTPKLVRVNGATDKALRVVWLLDDVTELQFPPVIMPPDLDAASDVTVHLLAVMSGATDTPTIDVQVFDAIGDTEMGGATAALSNTLQELTVTITAANVSGHPLGFLNITLTPAAHGTDAVHLHGAWIEYTRS